MTSTGMPEAEDDGQSRRRRLARLAALLVPLLVFGLAAWALHRELRLLRPGEIRAALAQVPLAGLLLALTATALGFVTMTAYDALALSYVGHPLPYRALASVSFMAASISNTTGFNAVTSGSIRYRFYSRAGVEPGEVYRVIAFCSLTFWTGYALLTGLLLLTHRAPLPARFGLQQPWPGLLGACLLLLLAAYLALCFRRTPVRLKWFTLDPPSPRLALLQVAASCADWILAAAVFRVLLPTQAGISIGNVLGVFLVAQLAGLLSTVPGGVGVFEVTVTYAFGPTLGTANVLGALVVYRLVYYVVPFLAGTLTLAVKEMSARRALLTSVGRAVGSPLAAVVPPLFALVSFLGGAVLLASGATPSIESRLHALVRIVPLPVIEMSSFLASCAGAVLLVVAAGLWRRLNGAYVLALGMLLSGSVFSLMKALDYEEALLLAGMFALLLPCRRHFYRRTPLLDQPFSPGWTLAMLLAASGFIWLGLFAHRHVEYSHDLWWRFSLTGHAPRYLRAAVGVMAVLLIAGLRRMLRPVKPGGAPPDANDLAAVRSILAQTRRTEGNLALLGDKYLLFSENRHAFVMYGVVGKSWVAMGDPSGPADEGREVAWAFRELCDRHAGYPVFYEVGLECLPLYLDMGLTLLKIGEEARIPLARLTFEGASFKKFRSALNRLDKEGFSFAVLPATETEGVLDELERVSATWLEGKAAREKGFSLGFFTRDYIRQCPVAVIRRGGEVVAFANLWLGGTREELSIDLMRYVPGTTDGLMDALLARVCLWGREQGYGHFSLGMAPLAGLDDHALAPLWHRLGAKLFHHGEHFYNFKGLRQYKEKFHPEWQPRYLASPGGFALPTILLGIASLIGGGLRGVLRK